MACWRLRVTGAIRVLVEPAVDRGTILRELPCQAVLVDSVEVMDTPFELVEGQLRGPSIAGGFFVAIHGSLPLLGLLRRFLRYNGGRRLGRRVRTKRTRMHASVGSVFASLDA